MSRHLAIAIAAAGLAGCGETPPMPAADGETIAYAVQQAQARADKASAQGDAAPEPGK